MSTHLISAVIAIATLSVATAGMTGSDSDDAHTLGDHPAVIINKTGVRPSYMSAMTIYPHPAWFWWSAQNPDKGQRAIDNSGKPAVHKLTSPQKSLN